MVRALRTVTRPIDTLLGLLVLCLVIAALPSKAHAQKLVVAKFSDRSGKKLGKKAWQALARELKKKGARLIAYKQYLQVARKNRIRAKQALKPRSVRKLAGKMKLAAVVTGSAVRKRRSYIVTVKAIGADGKTFLHKSYRIKRPVFPKKTAATLAGLIMDEIGGGTAAAAASPRLEPPPEPPPPAPPADAGTQGASGGTGDSLLPEWARTDEKKPVVETPARAAGPKEMSSSEAEVATGKREHAGRKAPRKVASVNDVLVSAAFSMHHRAGLPTRHEASAYPGLRFDARVFLGSFLDVPVVRDIGFGGMFDMSLGLEYAKSDEDTWDATQMQWRAELVYRLPLQTGLRPAFLVRLGYGATTTSIDAGPDETAALDTSYMAPYAALDIYLMLYEPYLRLFASGGFVFLVSAGEDVSGSGIGFSVLAGIDIDLVDALHLGVGYDLVQYVMDDDSAGGIGEYSDTYQGFFVRIGYNYH